MRRQFPGGSAEQGGMKAQNGQDDTEERWAGARAFAPGWPSFLSGCSCIASDLYALRTALGGAWCGMPRAAWGRPARLSISTRDARASISGRARAEATRATSCAVPSLESTRCAALAAASHVSKSPRSRAS